MTAASGTATAAWRPRLQAAVLLAVVVAAGARPASGAGAGRGGALCGAGAGGRGGGCNVSRGSLAANFRNRNVWEGSSFVQLKFIPMGYTLQKRGLATWDEAPATASYGPNAAGVQGAPTVHALPLRSAAWTPPSQQNAMQTISPSRFGHAFEDILAGDALRTVGRLQGGATQLLQVDADPNPTVGVATDKLKDAGKAVSGAVGAAGSAIGTAGSAIGDAGSAAGTVVGNVGSSISSGVKDAASKVSDVVALFQQQAFLQGFMMVCMLIIFVEMVIGAIVFFAASASSKD